MPSRALCERVWRLVLKNFRKCYSYASETIKVGENIQHCLIEKGPFKYSTRLAEKLAQFSNAKEQLFKLGLTSG